MDDSAAEERLAPADLQQLQRRKLVDLLTTVRAHSPFYRNKYVDVDFDPLQDPLEHLPMVTRAEIEADQQAHPPYGSIPTKPLAAYSRLHQTSGSSGQPLAWLDTTQSWAWWQACWRTIFRAADVGPQDRFMFPFSFGPFIGFWSAFETAAACGNLVLPGGGMSTTARLDFMIRHQATVVCCTPTYALRLAEIASQHDIDLRRSPVRALIVAGEPGGGIPATRTTIERAFGARLYDHAGMTEMGAWGFECHEQPGGMHIMENAFIAEVVDPHSGATRAEGQSGELVLTNLGRSAMPLIRYRTGDEVTLTRGTCGCGRTFARIEGGIRGRLDDMIFIRGNNVFPSTVENIVRNVPGITEFQMRVEQRGPLAELCLDIEPTAPDNAVSLVEQIKAAFVDKLHFKPLVRLVDPGSLPRFELKAQRLVKGTDDRQTSN